MGDVKVGDIVRVYTDNINRALLKGQPRNINNYSDGLVISIEPDYKIMTLDDTGAFNLSINDIQWVKANGSVHPDNDSFLGKPRRYFHFNNSEAEILTGAKTVKTVAVQQNSSFREGSGSQCSHCTAYNTYAAPGWTCRNCRLYGKVFESQE